MKKKKKEQNRLKKVVVGMIERTLLQSLRNRMRHKNGRCLHLSVGDCYFRIEASRCKERNKNIKSWAMEVVVQIKRNFASRQDLTKKEIVHHDHSTAFFEERRLHILCKNGDI